MNFAPYAEMHRNPWSSRIRKQPFWDDFFLVSEFGWVSNSPCVLFLCVCCRWKVFLSSTRTDVMHKRWNQMLNSEGTTIILACYQVCKHEVGLAAKLNIATFVACYWEHFMRACVHQTTNDGYLWCSIFCNLPLCYHSVFQVWMQFLLVSKQVLPLLVEDYNFRPWHGSLYKSFGHIEITILVVTELTLIKLLTSTWS